MRCCRFWFLSTPSITIAINHIHANCRFATELRMSPIRLNTLITTSYAPLSPYLSSSLATMAHNSSALNSINFRVLRSCISNFPGGTNSRILQVGLFIRFCLNCSFFGATESWIFNTPLLAFFSFCTSCNVAFSISWPEDALVTGYRILRLSARSRETGPGAEEIL